MDPLEVKVKQKPVICIIVQPTLEYGNNAWSVTFFHIRPGQQKRQSN